MRRNSPNMAAVAVAVCLLLLPMWVETTSWASMVPTSNQTSSAGWFYPTTSWALGIVVPEGAGLQDGDKVRWEEVSNVTAMVTLPNISLPDRNVYAVLSVMTSDGTVLQAAAGVNPNSSCWLAYSWSIPSVESAPLTYGWVLNGSEPRMAPQEQVTISIFRTSGLWNLRVADADTGSSVARSSPSGVATSLMAGGQEVFALESYSRTRATFQEMGNLTLKGLFVNGQKVTDGFYSYGQWDPSHNPVFVVGSSGTSPPPFISFQQGKNGSFVWGFARAWVSGGDPLAVIGASFVALLLALLAVLGAVVWLTREQSAPKSRSRVGVHA